uniref:Uncharacterized protein n=1 Tax=Macrostomum lignano TaxID=282301 RepID=A0A1I8J5N0_9PLAT
MASTRFTAPLPNTSGSTCWCRSFVERTIPLCAS